MHREHNSKPMSTKHVKCHCTGIPKDVTIIKTQEKERVSLWGNVELVCALHLQFIQEKKKLNLKKSDACSLRHRQVKSCTYSHKEKKASEERSPQTTSSKLSCAVPQSLIFQQASSAPLGLKLIFIALVSSMFLHICSKSYYKVSVI